MNDKCIDMSKDDYKKEIKQMIDSIQNSQILKFYYIYISETINKEEE